MKIKNNNFGEITESLKVNAGPVVTILSKFVFK